MKRKSVLLVISVSICCAFSACGSAGGGTSAASESGEKAVREDITAELTAATDDLFDELKEFDLDYLKTVCVDENGNAYSINGEDAEDGTETMEETTEAEENIESDALADYLQDCAKKITYSIDSVDEDNLAVTVTSDFVDSSDVWANYLLEALAVAFSGGNTEDAAVMDACFNQAVEDVTEEKMTSNQSVIYYEKSGDHYDVKYVSEEFYDVVTANSMHALASIGESTDDSAYTEAAEAVAYEGTDTTQGLVYKVTNNSEINDLCIEIDTIFYDTDGNMVNTDTEYINNLASGMTFYVSTYCDTAYASYETSIATSQSFYIDVTDQLMVQHNDGSDGVVVKMTNNGETEILEADLAVVYYKGGTMVGCQMNYGFEIQPGKFDSETVSHPYSNVDYNEISYDTYEIYAYAIANEY